MSPRLRAALVASAALSLLLSACSPPALPGATPGAPSPGADGSPSASAPSLAPITADPALRNKLPQKMRDAGVVVIGVDATYKPNEYLDTDGKTVIGMDVELFDAVAARLGVKTRWAPSQFDQILVGIAAGKYDVGVSSFTINDNRKQSVNMVSYLRAGTQWAVAAGNPKQVDRANVCGLTIAYQTGTVQDDEMKAAQATCSPDKKITQLSFTDQGEVTAALVSGRAAAMLADSPITDYAIKMSGGKIEQLGEVYDAAPYGIVVPKDQPEFADAIRSALEDVRETGHYDAVLAKYGLKKAAIAAFQVNP